MPRLQIVTKPQTIDLITRERDNHGSLVAIINALAACGFKLQGKSAPEILAGERQRQKIFLARLDLRARRKHACGGPRRPRADLIALDDDDGKATLPQL